MGSRASSTTTFCSCGSVSRGTDTVDNYFTSSIIHCNNVHFSMNFLLLAYVLSLGYGIVHNAKFETRNTANACYPIVLKMCK
jgi:hypothetical protein